MKYTKDFFGNNGKNWINWLSKFIGKPNLRFLEIGCFEGRATVWLLDHILTNKTSLIETIDTFNGSLEHKGKDFIDNIEKNYQENISSYNKQVITHKGISQEILREFNKYEVFDFIYIDGSHQAPDVLEDTLLSFRLLKHGGILIFDDYSWGVNEFDDILLRPKIAIDSFLEVFKGKYTLIAKERQVCICKI